MHDTNSDQCINIRFLVKLKKMLQLISSGCLQTIQKPSSIGKRHLPQEKKKAGMSRWKFKTMFIVFDIQSVIMVQSIPCSQTVNQQYYN